MTIRHAFLPVLLLAGALPAQLPNATPLRRVTFTTSGGNFDQTIEATRVSDDGRRVLFVTTAQNVGVGTPVPGRRDIYMLDRVADRIDVVGIGLAVNPNISDAVHMSADGRFVVFHGAGENGGVARACIWLRDTFTGALELIDRNARGEPAAGSTQSANGVSADGRYVLFTSDAPDLPGTTAIGFTLYRLDRQRNAYEVALIDSAGRPRTAGFGIASMSSNGRFVTFPSQHEDLVPDDTNGRFDHFVRDMDLGVTERLSVGTGGLQANGSSQRPATISADGRFAIFATSSRNFFPELTATNGPPYVVRDRAANTTRVLAVSPFGRPAVPSSSAFLENPRFIDRTHTVIYATPVLLLDRTPEPLLFTLVYATDVDTGTTVMVSNRDRAVADRAAHLPAVSPNGRHIVFLSSATNLDPNSLPPSGFANDVVFHTGLDCAATSESFGRGSAGTGGIVPLLAGTNAGCDAAIQVLAGGLLGGSPTVALFGTPAARPVVLLGVDLHVDVLRPFAAVAVPNGGLPGVGGAGSWLTSLPVAALTDNALGIQVVCLDPGAPAGLAATNGLVVQVN